MNATSLLITGTAVVWLIYDIYAYVTGNVSTISHEMVEFSYYSPTAPLVIGIILGHWWPFYRKGDCNEN